MMGKNLPFTRPNKLYQSDTIVIVNAANIYLTGRKMKYRKFYKPSSKVFFNLSNSRKIKNMDSS